MVEDLMPLSSEAPRCTEFARSLGVLPLGSGLFLSRVVVVTVPLPWPKPALRHPLLASVAPHVAGADVPSRLFAAEPEGDQAIVELFERRGSQAAQYRWKLETPDSIEPLIAAICQSDVGSAGEASVSGTQLDVAGSAPGPTFLVCTQGSHDTCCGTSGVALADQIESQRPDYEVRRVSHTGGHRFSPTFLAFPEGRMWAYADLDLVDRVALGDETADDFCRRGRGWWGAKVGPMQVAEGVVRAELAGQTFDAPTIEAVNGTEDDDGYCFIVTTSGGAWRITVHVERIVPTIACEMPGGLPAKPGREFGWSIEVLSATVSA